MKYIIEDTSDLYKLATMWCKNEITADEYFEACDTWAKMAIEREILEEKTRRQSSLRDSKWWKV